MKQHIDNIKEAVLEAVVAVQCRTLAMAAPAQRNRSTSVMVGTLLIALLSTGTAVAQSPGCKNNEAANKLVDFINGAAQFVMLIGGAAAVLAFAVGAFFIIVGGTGDKVNKGKKYILNAVIGLVVLAAGALIKYVVVNFVAGAAGDKGESDCVSEDTGI